MAGSGAARYSKMTALINYRLRVTMQDGRILVGQLLAFDKFMNLVLSDCEEFRQTKKASAISAAKKKALAQGMTPAMATLSANMEERRTLGLLVLRGENVVSIVVESGPPPESSGAQFQRAPGVPLMLGASGPMPGLAGAVKGVVGGIPGGPMPARPPPMPAIPGIAPGMIPSPAMAPGMVPPPPPGMMVPPPPPPFFPPPPPSSQ